MNQEAFVNCMRLIETKWRGMRGAFTVEVSKTFGDVIADWEDYDAERAVHRWTYEASETNSLDIAQLVRIYKRLRHEGEESSKPYRLDVTRPGYEAQRAGVSPRQLMVEGYMEHWRAHHPNEDPPRNILARLREFGLPVGGADPFGDDEPAPAPRESRYLTAAARARIEAEVAAHSAGREQG